MTSTSCAHTATTTTTPAPRAPRAENDATCLSDRERQVIELIARGHSNTEIAAELYLSINSVKTYIRMAYRKMGVSTRSRAVVWAYRHGLADVADVADRVG